MLGLNTITVVDYSLSSLDKNYVLFGLHDIGTMALGKDPEIENYPSNVVDVKYARGKQVGKLAIGHVLIYLSGRIIFDEIDDSPHATITAMSVGGCSGCPLFIHDDVGVPNQMQAMLFSFLHGYMKYRHSRVAIEDASNHLFFADEIRYGTNKLQLETVVADAEVQAALRLAEELELLDAVVLGQEFALTPLDCNKFIQRIAEKPQVPFSLTATYEVNTIMALLAEKALPDQQQTTLTLWDESSMMRCVVPDTPE